LNIKRSEQALAEMRRMIARTLRHRTSSDDIAAEFLYLKPMQARPRNYTHTPPPGELQSNAVYETRRKTVHNLRALPDATSLDVQGFTLLHEPTTVENWYDEGTVRSVYYPAVECLLKELTGAARVLAFDHITRRRLSAPTPHGEVSSRQPIRQAHVDYTPLSGLETARRYAGDALSLLDGRVRIINVWRPLRGPLYDAPLAVCDARTVDPKDLVATDLVYPDKVWETYSVTFNPAQQWFYAPGMMPDELLLFKCFDSETDGRARFTPHAAFDDPTVTADVMPRESIEARALIFG
jgi:hypothetical protein